MRKMRVYRCEDCGAWTHRNRASIQPKICKDCSADRAESAAREMARRSGPAYERFLETLAARGRPPAQNAKG